MADHKRFLRVLVNGPVRRSLFGPVDREQLQLEYNAALRKDLEEASHRWNFDFISEKPLEGGDFQWEGVSGVRVPVLYRTCKREERQRSRESDARSGPSPAGKENIARTPKRFISVTHDLEKTPEKKETQKRKQTNITDFYQAKKRQIAAPRKSGQ